MSDSNIESFAPDLRPELVASAAPVVTDTVLRPRRRRRNSARWLAPLIGLLAAAALVSVFWQPQFGATALFSASTGGARAPAAATPAGDVARYPIDAGDTAQPPLDASDAVLEAGVRALLAGGTAAALIEPLDFVRSVVATVDNLPRRSLFGARMPVKAVPGPFQTTFGSSGLAIAESNGSRYVPYVRLLERLDGAKLVALYTRHYPLFQQAYRDMGYANAHFNDRLVEAIDVALATPQVAPPLRVVQPRIHYEYVDRALENLPAAQKLMLRMGPGNAAIVKSKLAEIRALLVRGAGPGAAAR